MNKIKIIILLFVITGALCIGLFLVFLDRPYKSQNNIEPISQAVIDRLSTTLVDPYSIKDGKIYYQSSVMEGVDIATFEPSHYGFSKDKNFVYHTTEKINGADPSTFEFFLDSFIFTRDKNHVYVNNQLVKDADPKTFIPIKGTNYFRDKKHIFIEGEAYKMEILTGADPLTFEPLGSTYSKDERSIYFRTESVPNSDPKTFQSFIKEGDKILYFRDKNIVYHFEGGPLLDSNPETFERLGSVYSGYAHDSRHAYFMNDSISTADFATFKVIGDGYAEDKNYLYFQGKIIFDLSTGPDPFKLAAAHILEITPKDNTIIDYIVNTYYELTLFYGNSSKYNIFGFDQEMFFEPYFNGLKRSGFDLATFVPFRLAFVAQNSPASLFDFPQPVGPGIGGDIVGRKLLDTNTLLVYARSGMEDYLGASARLCKGGGDVIDKFIFKKINGEWKIWEIAEIDSWPSQNEGDTEEECKEINQNRILRYQIGE